MGVDIKTHTDMNIEDILDTTNGDYIQHGLKDDAAKELGLNENEAAFFAEFVGLDEKNELR